MGEAKNRGSFEKRKKAAIERNQKLLLVQAEIERRRPSPKHTALMAMVAAMIEARGVGND